MTTRAQIKYNGAKFSTHQEACFTEDERARERKRHRRRREEMSASERQSMRRTNGEEQRQRRAVNERASTLGPCLKFANIVKL